MKKTDNSAVEKLLLSSDDEAEDSSDLNQNRANKTTNQPVLNHEQDTVMTDKEDDSINTLDEQASMEIDLIEDSELPILKTPEASAIQQFKKLSHEMKCIWIQQQANSKGDNIHLDTIQLWSEDQIIRTATNMIDPKSTSPANTTNKSNLKKKTRNIMPHQLSRQTFTTKS